MTSHTMSNTKADLTIIGAGGAGLAAAVSAAENGIRNILILEKRPAIGGNTNFVTGVFAAESPVQKRALIDCRVENCFKIAMNFAHWRINPRIVMAYMAKSGDTIEWLEKRKLSFTCVPFFPNQIPTWHVCKGYGPEIIRVLLEDCKSNQIKLLTNMAAKRITRGSEGQITGVLAGSENEDLYVETSRVIIATGGYAGNKELLKKFAPNYVDNMACIGVPHTGDGLTMALDAGAATEGLGLLAIAGPQVPGFATLKIGSPKFMQEVPLMAIALEPTTIWINNRGKRFADESISAHHFLLSNAVNRQPNNQSFTIFDSDLVQEQTAKGLIIGMGQSAEIAEQRTHMTGLAQELQKPELSQWVKVTDSWDSLAIWIGADPGTLKHTIDEFNTSCTLGSDSILAKDPKYMRPLRTPPFYAIKCSSDIIDTLGGIKINERMQVLDKQDNPIPGLFAAGVVAGGWESDTYCDILSGHTSGFALNSGRIAGESASQNR